MTSQNQNGQSEGLICRLRWNDCLISSESQMQTARGLSYWGLRPNKLTIAPDKRNVIPAPVSTYPRSKEDSCTKVNVGHGNEPDKHFPPRLP